MKFTIILMSYFFVAYLTSFYYNVHYCVFSATEISKSDVGCKSGLFNSTFSPLHVVF